MCTLTFAWQRFDAHVAVAANRDEALSRPASGPAISGDSPWVFAPRDEKAGGTWIGYNEAGLFVALTNRWTRTVTDGERSRGLLVRDALDRSSAAAAARFVRGETEKRRYEPFHLLVADADRALLIEHDRTRSVTDLAPGVYVVGNTGWCGVCTGPDDATDPQRTTSFFVPGDRPEIGRTQAHNDELVLDTLVEAADGVAGADEWLERAGSVLSDHEYGVCVHRDGFGTKSSSLVRLGAERAWIHAEGPPCENEYEPLEAP